MNLTFHILKKDIRRLRIFLIFWFLTVLLAAGVNLIHAPTGDLAVQSILKLVAALVAMCQFIMMALIVPFLMHSEPLTGTTAFWLTRPIKKSEVLKSKLLFCGLFFVLLPVVTNIVLLATNRVPVAYILASVPETLLNSIGSLLLLMTLSVLTRSFGRFALAGGGYLIISIVLGASIGIFQKFYLQDSAPAAVALTDSRALLSELAGILFLSAIIFFQYRTRRTGRAFALLAMELILVLSIGLYSPWTIFRIPSGSLSKDELKEISLAVSEHRLPSVSDAISFRGVQARTKKIQSGFRYMGLPTNSFAVTRKIDATFSTSGAVIKSEVFENYKIYSSPINTAALGQMLYPLLLIEGDSYFSNTSTLLKISEPDYLIVKNKSGLYEADVSFNVFQYQPVALLPLEIGAEYSNKASLRSIESILQETQGCTVILRKQSINPLFIRKRIPSAGDKYIYLLINKKTGEAYLPEKNSPTLRRYSVGGSSLAINNNLLRFSSIDKGRLINPIDEAWLKDAELMIIEIQWLGEAKKHVEDATFLFGDSTVSKSDRNEPRMPDNGNKDALSKIKLPENPTRDEVTAYIQKIHTISSTQSSYGWRDPQVEMLIKIGSENLDLLIPFARRGSSLYEPIVIKRLASPKDKELILSSLRDIPALAEVVMKFGWQEDARNEFLKMLGDGSDHVDVSVIRAAASLKDPETYPALINYFICQSGKSHTYAAIKDLPGIDLAYAFPKAWENAQDSSFELQRLIEPALDFGLEDALGAIIKYLYEEPISDYWRDHFHTSFLKHTGISGTREELRKWYLANKGALRFDIETKMFVVK